MGHTGILSSAVNIDPLVIAVYTSLYHLEATIAHATSGVDHKLHIDSYHDSVDHFRNTCLNFLTRLSLI